LGFHALTVAIANTSEAILTPATAIVAPIAPEQAKADLFGAEAQSNVVKFDRSNAMHGSRSRPARAQG